ncbi:MAG TPA: DUF1440 domain-containing protein [Ktedonobacteraceae bacterium]|nr:DUF1440 domain-containing protein [Ktedonobacteraceae bacterium]
MVHLKDRAAVQPEQAEQAFLNGALSGLIATIPMTIFMLVTQRFLPKGQHYDLPPELITKDVARKMHARWHMNKVAVLVATLLAHSGYGTTMGILYEPVRQRILLPPPLRGIFFGFFVWAASYFVLLPLLGIAETGEKESGRRNLMMLAAHVVWGSTLGVAAHFLPFRQGE